MHDPHVFISYSHEDHIWFDKDYKFAFMPRLIKQLEKFHHAHVWYDKSRLVAGDLWQEEIEQAINRSDFAVLLISPEFLISDFIQNEELPRIVKRAAKRELVIIPILLKNCPHEQLDVLLHGPQMIPGKPTPLIDYTMSESKWDGVQNEIYESIAAQIRKPKPTPLSDLFPTPQPTPGSDSAQKDKPGRVRGKILGILLAITIVAGLVAWFATHNHKETITADPEFVRNLNALNGGLPWLNWILYDPSEYDPFKNKMPSEASIRQDLNVLRTNGFNGLITTNSRGSCGVIPRIAHETGFNLVISGVWDLRDENEITAAIQDSQYADAFCLGHRGLNRSYSFGELDFFVKDFRNRTKKPVTTSEAIGEYEVDRRLVEIGDFLFPDAHPGWQQAPVPETAWAETATFARQAAQLTAGTNKLTLLKMVSFPSGGAANLSPAVQLRFYRLAVEQAREHVDFPSSVYFSYMSAFDPVWKTRENGFQETEMFTGLFTQGRQPKPAVTEVRWTPHQ